MNGKQALLLIALIIVVWIPAMLVIFGVIRMSDRQMSLLAPVNLIFGVGTLILAYRKWISKIK